MSIAYRQNGGVESSGGGGAGSTSPASTLVSVSQLLDSSGGSVQAADSANNAIRVNVVAGAASGSTIVTISSLPLISSAVQNSNSSALNVRIVGGVSSAVDFKARADQGIGNSSQADRWLTGSMPLSTNWASSAGFHFNSSGELQVTASVTTSTIVTVARTVGNSSAADYMPARLVDSSGTGFHGPSNPIAFAVTDSSNAVVKSGDSANNAIRVNVVAGAAGGSTVVTVARMVGNSSAVDYMPVRIVDSSGTGFVAPGLSYTDGSTASVLEAPALAFDNGSNVTMRLVGQATPLPVRVFGPASTTWASSAGFHFDSSGALQVAASVTTSTIVTVARQVGNSSAADYMPVRLVDSSGTGFHGPTNPVPFAVTDSSNAVVKSGDSANNAIRVNVVAGSAASTIVTVSSLPMVSSAAQNSNSSALNVRVVGGVSSAADFVATVTPSAGSTFNVRPLQSSAADLQATVTPVSGSTWNVRPLQSSAADLQATVTPAAGSTFNVRPLQSSAADLNASVQPIAGSTWRTQPGSTAWASSAGFHFDGVGSLLIAKPEFDSTYASGVITSSGDTTIISSGASTRINVFSYHFTVDSTNPIRVRLLNGSTVEMARWVFRAPSSISIGANLAVSIPSYLYRTAVANALILNLDSTGPLHYSIAAYRST